MFSTDNEEFVANKSKEEKGNEKKRQGILSFSNHVSLFDDPLLFQIWVSQTMTKFVG